MFISLEGIDGSGKSSISKMLEDYLKSKNLKVFLTEEPTKEIFDVKSLMEMNLDVYTRIFIFMADRVEHIKKIKRAIEEGYVVISDRYVDSTFAYQGAVLKSILKDMEKAYQYLDCIYNPFRYDPDIIFYLDVDPKIGISRIKRKREFFEDIEFLEDVRNFYLFLSLKRKYVKIDSNGSLEYSFKNILKYMEKI
ncbi:MAG: dTMP kinase [Thermoplasmata archaeon]